MKFDCNCLYCTKNTFLWSIDKKIAWVEIPKNGSYNIKTIKFNYDSSFPDNFDNTPLRRESLNSIKNFKRVIVVLRDPVDRFKSLVSHYFISGKRADAGLGKAWLNTIGIDSCNESNIIDMVLNNFDKVKNIREPHHFNSQLSFIPKSVFDSNVFFLDVSELGLFFNLNERINSSNSQNINLTTEQIQRIQQIYKEDVELYNTYIKNI